MNRLENGSAFADGSRRKQSHRAADDRTFIRQDIAESILRHHHIKERRLLNHTHGRIVHIHIIRSEEHTSELQSRQYLVCRLLLEKKKLDSITRTHT